MDILTLSLTDLQRFSFHRHVPNTSPLKLSPETGTNISTGVYFGAKLEVHSNQIKSTFSTDRAQKADAASYAAPPTLL
jgi:hypothetical protein